MSRRKTAWILAALLGASGLGAALLWMTFQRSGLPWRDGERPLATLGAEVTVRFDAAGVPHVRAETVADAMRALGWLHANDRMTQMELGRRAARGRLSEVLGEAAVELDSYFLTLDFPRGLETLWNAASAESRVVLEAYAEGVNAWLTSRGGDLPPGLRLLGTAPEPWLPRDSLAFSLLMARDLSFWDGRPEEERFRWLRAFGVEGVRDLLGAPDLHVPEALLELASEMPSPLEMALPKTSSTDGLEELLGDGALRGSNNWAVAGDRAEAGAPLIANDPHLPLFLPSVWYQVHLRAPGYEAAGMSLPGTPGVVLGRGPSVAWAFTNVMLDDHDLFFERLDDTGERYLRDGEWKPVESETVTFAVRGGETRELRVRRTDRGPLLDADPLRGLPPRSVRWTAHLPSDPVAAIRAVAAATTPEELFAATESYGAPAQNLVAAFAGGEIAHTVLGGIPERRHGDGRMPSPGWDTRYGWQGLRARADNPRRVNPPDGLIVTANHDIRPEGYELPLVADFFAPTRADRIRQLLLGRGTWLREDFSDLQMDIESLHAKALIEALHADAPFEGDARRAYEALRDWDRRLTVHGASALFVLAEREWLELIFGDETRRAGLQKHLGHRDRLLRLLDGEMSPRWFDDLSTPEVEDRADRLAAGLSAAWREGERRWGGEVATWNYGEIHALTLAHRLDQAPIYGSWSRRGPFPVAGSATTVLAFGGAWESAERQKILYGPSMRYVVDWSRPDVSWAILPGGQSGHPGDPHYDDQIRPFLAGELRESPWSESAIEAATVSLLRLLP